MTREEAKQILQLVVATFPGFKPKDMSMTINSWSYFFGDKTSASVAAAFREYVKRGNSFAPSPADLIKIINEWGYKEETRQMEREKLMESGLIANDSLSLEDKQASEEQDRKTLEWLESFKKKGLPG